LATTAIEGNTLTEDEVRQRIDGTLQLSPSKEYLGVEIDNVVRASRTMLDRCVKGDIPGLTPELISDLNREVLSGLKLEAHVVPGEFRTYSVGVADYRGAPQGELPELVKRLCKWLDE